jgi:hypothetical protein
MKLDEILESFEPEDDDYDEEAAMDAYFDKFRNMTEPQMIAAVKEDPDNIMHMPHATEKVQLTAVKEYGGALRNFWAERPSKAVVNAALTEPTFVHDARSYDALVKDMFADNSIMMHKWIRYGQNMRNM